MLCLASIALAAVKKEKKCLLHGEEYDEGASFTVGMNIHECALNADGKGWTAKVVACRTPGLRTLEVGESADELLFHYSCIPGGMKREKRLACEDKYRVGEKYVYANHFNAVCGAKGRRLLSCLNDGVTILPGKSEKIKGVSFTCKQRDGEQLLLVSP